MLLSGILADYGWRSVYYVLAALTVALMVPLALMLKRRIPEAASVHADTMSRTNARSVSFSPRTLQWLLALAGISRLISGLIADRLGGVMTLLIGSTLQCIALFLYLPFDGLASLYVVSLVFGLSQGGIVPSYAIIVREYLPAKEAGARVGLVIMSTIVGMALGGWMSGWIYDVTGSYQAAFLNGIAFNFLNIGIMGLILVKSPNGAGVGLRVVFEIAQRLRSEPAMVAGENRRRPCRI